MLKGQVILICGYRRTGKDVLASILNSQYDLQRFRWRIYSHPQSNEKLEISPAYTRVAFADLLKQEAHQEYGTQEPIPEADKDLKQFIHFQTGQLVSARDIYIEWGGIRRSQDPDYWCRAAFKEASNDSQLVVTDWRFINEFRYAFNQFQKVLTIRVYRSEVPEPEMKIASEHSLDDYQTDFLLLPDTGIIFSRRLRDFPSTPTMLPMDGTLFSDQ